MGEYTSQWFILVLFWGIVSLILFVGGSFIISWIITHIWMFFTERKIKKNVHEYLKTHDLNDVEEDEGKGIDSVINKALGNNNIRRVE